ncbi:threonine-phosphate decarboxylase CobD [Xanthobacter sp. ZOL 2024]
MRDHGGDLDRALALHGAGDWLDLSTGINPVAYPLPPLPASAWTALPAQEARKALEATAQAAFGAAAPVLAVAGAQAAIQLMPQLVPPGRARVLGPTYNEHAAALAAMGWTVDTVATAEALAGADLAVIVNPNNPDGRRMMPEALMGLAPQVGLLVVDESFADPEPDLSILPHLGPAPANILVLRSFGKFFGLAGVRLGFAVGAPHLVERLRRLAGPWPVSGPALVIGQAALADRRWQQDTRSRLAADARRLDGLAAAAGWRLIGGTALFRTYDTGDAAAAQARLAQGRVWSRIFPWSRGWLRLGLAGSAGQWRQLERAFAPIGRRAGE